jgi:hypothetical integral membrane protein (TIGR02206 family)
MPEHFTVFSKTHFYTVISGFFLLALLIAWSRRSDFGKMITTGILAFFCLGAYGLSQYAWSYDAQPTDLDNLLPFHLCDVCAFLAGYAILTKKPLACELTYYWGLAATIQALITPAIGYGFPHPTYFTFFLQHFAIVGVALFLPLTGTWRPVKPLWKSPLQAFVWVNFYMIFAMSMNFLLKTNFGYLAHPPPNPSLIDHLGPWPYYIIGLETMALLLFLLLTLPFMRKNRATATLAG